MALENRQDGPRPAQHRLQLASDQGAARPAGQRPPELAGARLRRGIRLYSEERFAEAIEEFRAALQLHPQDFHAQICLANTLLDLHRPEEALLAFRMALAISPQDGPDLLHALGYGVPGL